MDAFEALRHTSRPKPNFKLIDEDEFVQLRRIVRISATMITPENLENWFTYHSPSPDQLPKYQAIRDAAHHLAKVIVENSPASSDQTAAIRLVREAAMTANAAIACGGK